MSDPQQPWEPDRARMGNWEAMFQQRRGGGQPPEPPPSPNPPLREAFDDNDAAAVNLAEYKPWTLQRGGGRPVMMLALRRFDVRADLWSGWMMAYHSLYAIDHLGDRMVSLDFGVRHFILEGVGLDQLVRVLQQGTVAQIVEYAAPIWTACGDGPVVRTIRPIRLNVDG